MSMRGMEHARVCWERELRRQRGSVAVHRRILEGVSEMKMRWILCPGLLVALAALSQGDGMAYAKTWDSATLKDVQPLTAPTKHEKHQGYDLLISDNGEVYTCRYDGKGSFKPTDYPVGSQVTFHLDGQKGKMRDMAGKHQVSCRVVRVEAPGTQR